MGPFDAHRFRLKNLKAQRQGSLGDRGLCFLETSPSLAGYLTDDQRDFMPMEKR